MNKNLNWFFLFICSISILSLSCAIIGYTNNSKENNIENQAGSEPPIPGDPGASGVYMDIEEDPANPGSPGQGLSSASSNLPLKPVGFINVGIFNATVQPWSYIPLGTQEFQTPVYASTVASAKGGGGDSPNTSSYLKLPMGTYTWCVDWEEEDKDGDGKFDYYHYIENGLTLLDENDSDDLEFAETVTVSAPPDTAFVSKGRCGAPALKEDCTGKTTYFKSFVGNVLLEPIYPLDVYAYANTAYRASPSGIKITASNPENNYFVNIILAGSGSWIEATTSDPYSAMGVSIFGDQTIGWARIFFDNELMWEGDTSECVINPDENSGLGWYGLYAEAICVTPGTHTIRVESGPTKEEVGGWQGGVPVQLFGFRW